MKILLTCDPEIPVPPVLYGGIERIVDVLVNAYVAAGHDVTLCANAASKVPCNLMPWKGAKSQNFADTIRSTSTLTRLVFTQKFDIIHSFSRLAYMTAVMPLKVPKIMSYQREPSLQQIGKAVKLARKNSLIFTGCSNYITSKTQTVAEAYTIYNCVPIEKFKFQPVVEDDTPLVFLGRIEDIKGAHIAVEVAQQSGKRLIIAGNIPQGKEAYYEQAIKPHLNDRIQYIGVVNDEQKNDILGRALAFLMPIQWNEPFGIVMAEAMACGTPVVGFAFGSVPEVVQNGINGFVCSDVEQMIGAVSKAKEIDRKTVRQAAEEKFSNTKVVKDYLHLYEQLISRNR